jgi:hypothetical protein
MPASNPSPRSMTRTSTNHVGTLNQPIQGIAWSTVIPSKAQLEKLRLLSHSQKELKKVGYVLKPLDQGQVQAKLGCLNCGSMPCPYLLLLAESRVFNAWLTCIARADATKKSARRYRRVTSTTSLRRELGRMWKARPPRREVLDSPSRIKGQVLVGKKGRQEPAFLQRQGRRRSESDQ